METTADLLREIGTLKKRIAELESAQQWQPIGTAPKDGTEVLLLVPKRSNALIVSALNRCGSQWWGAGVGALKPTHWMPLPKAPE